MNKKINKLSRNYDLLKNKDIIDILEEELKGWKIKESEKNDSEFILHNISGGRDGEIIFDSGYIDIIKKEKKSAEIITIMDGPTVRKFNCEKRPKGIILKDTIIRYGYTPYSDEDKYPVKIEQNSYSICYNDDTVVKSGSAKEYASYFSEFVPSEIERMSVYSSSFETDFNYYATVDAVTKNVVKVCHTHTDSDGIDISFMYEAVDGPDRLLRILDLYNGIINDRNIGDIQNIREGKMFHYAFDARNSISEEEDKVLSKRDISNGEINKKSYLVSNITKGLVKLKSLSREEVLSALLYQPTQLEELEFSLLKEAGMTYDNFAKLDNADISWVTYDVDNNANLTVSSRKKIVKKLKKEFSVK